MKTIQLAENVEIPLLGLGTWQMRGDACRNAVLTALEVGYRHIDTADVYGNHKEVGQALKESNLKREEIFITTKIPKTYLRKEHVLESADRYLEELDVPYIDLLLIHWPNKNIPIDETLEAMESLREEGIIRAIGVSNFTIHHIEDVLRTGIRIVNNQVELHPTFNQKELFKFCTSKNISLTAYSPLGMGDELQNPTILELSEKYKVSPAQVILNWITSQGIIAIPKSSHPDRIKDNFQALSWEMEKEDLEKIDNIPQKERMLDFPGTEFDY